MYVVIICPITPLQVVRVKEKENAAPLSKNTNKRRRQENEYLKIVLSEVIDMVYFNL